MSADIGLFEAMNTQRAIRYLKPDPVPDEMISQLMEAAIKAPSGTNQQQWSFLVIKDPELRRKLGDIYQKAGRAAIPRIQYVEAENKKLFNSAVYLVDHLGEAPVLILACISHGGSTGLTTGASIYPAVQNILLAARALDRSLSRHPRPSTSSPSPLSAPIGAICASDGASRWCCWGPSPNSGSRPASDPAPVDPVVRNR